jgi:hypothetical protein
MAGRLPERTSVHRATLGRLHAMSEQTYSEQPQEQNASEGPQIRVQQVKFWLNAFISPDHIDGPPGFHCFHGDGRGYSADVHARSRLHSEVEISGLGTAQPHISLTWNHCDESIQIDCDTKAELDRKSPDPSRCGWHNLRCTGGSYADPWSVDFVGAVNNPCVIASPDVDVNGTFSIDPLQGHAYFQGMVDVYPWYEGYVAFNNGAPVTMFQLEPSGTPFGLYGGASRAVSVSVAMG